MRSLKKKLNKELDFIVSSSLSDDVLATPIAIQKENQNQVPRKIWIPCAASVAFIGIAIGSYFLLQPDPDSMLTLLTLEINPKASFLSDHSGKIFKVSSLNKEADIILSDPDFYQSLLYLPAEESLERFVDQAARLGYVNLNEDGNAIKVSAYEETENIAKKVTDTLEEYFINQGSYTIVVSDHLDLKQFCDDYHLSYDKNIKKLVSQLEETEIYQFENDAKQLNEETIAQHYQETFLYTDIRENIRLFIKQKSELILQSAEAVEELFLLNKKIAEHEDNPMWLLKDYWSVKNLSDPANYTDSFRLLMDTMQNKLNEYAQLYRYGVSISSAIELSTIHDHYQSIPLEQLLSILDDFSIYYFDLFVQPLLNILNDIGENVYHFNELLTLPETIADYQNKVLLSFQLQAKRLQEEYEELYLTARESLSKNDYQHYIDQLKEQYGSLINYWNEIKK